MTAIAPPAPFAPPSLDNPLTVGQSLWRVIHPRCGPMLERGTVTDLNWHYAQVAPESPIKCGTPAPAPEWIDSRDLLCRWNRSKRAAALQLLCLEKKCFGSLTSPAILIYSLEDFRDTARRPKAWAARLKPTQGEIHPRTIAAAFRRLASLGLAVRAPGRRGRWKTLTEPLP